MWMGNYQNNYITKLRPILLAYLLATATFTLTANIVLSLTKYQIVKRVNKNFFKPVKIRNIFYLPPNFLIIDDISVYENHKAPKKTILYIPRAKITISPVQLILKKRLRISKVNFSMPQGKYPVFAGFLKENAGQILEFLRSRPRQDIKISVKESRLELALERGNLKNDFTMDISGDSIAIEGYLRKTLHGPKEMNLPPLKYKMRGILTYGGIIFEKIELAKEDLYCQFWGEWNANIIELKGYTAINTIFSYQNYTSSIKPPAFSAPSGANLYIMDIDSRLKINFPNVSIEHLTFLINNNPVKLSGNLSFAEPFTCDFKLNSNFRSMEQIKTSLLKNISVNASVKLTGDKINFNGTLDIVFPEKKKGGLPLEKIALDLKELDFSRGASPLLRLNTGKLGFFCQTTANEYKIDLDDLVLEFYKLTPKTKLIKFRSRFYDGRVEGNGRIEIRNFTPVITALLRIKKSESNKLDGILKHFAKIHGKLGSQMYFTSYPQLTLKGGLNIQNGYIEDFEFFKWLARLFDLPSLKRIDFAKANSDFLINEEGASLIRMNMNSPDVKLNGDFKLGANDMVSSKMLLSFSQPLLTTSRKFTPLLRLLENKLEFLNFDFQMSGNLNRMNFQWLKSDFRDKVSRAIPGFMERKIERNIEEFINTIQTE